MDFYVNPKNPKHFKCSIKNFIPNVSKQKHRANSLPHVLGDMFTCIHSMNGICGYSSPQPFVDDLITSFRKAEPFITDPQNGKLKCQVGDDHFLDDVEIIKGEDKIKDAIIKNYGEGGPKLPIAAKFDHAAILITGVDIMSTNEDSHLVECGYTKVTFDFFSKATILVPVLDMESRMLINRLCITNLVGHKLDIKDMCFSASGRYLATASKDGVRVVDLLDAASKHIEFALLNTHDKSHPTALCWTEDLSIVVATENEISLRMFEENELKQNYHVKWCQDDIALGRDDIAVGRIALSNPILKVLGSKLEGTPFLVASATGAKIKICHGQDYSNVKTAKMRAKDNIMSISPNGRYLAAAFCDNPRIVMVLVLSKAQEVFQSDYRFRLNGHEADVTSVCFASNSQRIITASKDGKVRVWDIPSVDPSGILDLQPTTVIEYTSHTSQADTDPKYYTNITISRDGKVLAVSGGSLLRWILIESGRILETIGRAHRGDITCLSWSPEPVGVGNKRDFLLATTGVDKCVKLWATPKFWVAPS